MKLIARVLLPAVTALLAGPGQAQEPVPAALPGVEAQVQQAALGWLKQDIQRRNLTLLRASATVLPNRRPAPACAGPYDITPAETHALTRLRFAVRCPGTGRASVYQVRAAAYAKVLVSARAIQNGEALTPQDVTLAERDLAATPDALTDPADLAQRSSRRTLQPGQVIQKRFLKGTEAVRRGQSVQIVARTGEVEVRAIGTALQGGAQDDVIRVRNASTGKIIHARVSAAGVVEPVGMASTESRTAGSR
ncbi:flagellar basal body P-ring formation chaperone FlgA [Paraburkholderia bonniea]|uniref:flagellar basal body P-ring formation chaperone FlgA n=1 Tax=Paraburkholderia bonniea TaxID=2152891 RepID=UPI001291E962|nr:flagellar basal body P-ring formation chaperone FlgA [Paraburkholderia bonniea]WJF90788.1 flagellar basal body P-ring formation chaperone FlgA [Paraburkholderia bonniea]WJF94102.1 flagellar basal body P-ring formation chaperone FlgA [Paraburkholderia bonniea]